MNHLCVVFVVPVPVEGVGGGVAWGEEGVVVDRSGTYRLVYPVSVVSRFRASAPVLTSSSCRQLMLSV